MTTLEFSNAFDTLLNSYSSDNSITLDEYEKSVYLTKAQEDLLLDYYNGKNSFRESYDKNEEVRRYLSSLTKTSIITDKEEGTKSTSKSTIFYLPEDLWFILYEAVNPQDDNLKCYNGEYIEVVPVTYDELHRTLKNPFRGDSNKRALRLDLEDNSVEIIYKYNIQSYFVKYISKPSPIILMDLPEELTINNVNSKTECMLHEALHQAILQRAVELSLNMRVPASK